MRISVIRSWIEGSISVTPGRYPEKHINSGKHLSKRYRYRDIFSGRRRTPRSEQRFSSASTLFETEGAFASTFPENLVFPKLNSNAGENYFREANLVGTNPLFVCSRCTSDRLVPPTGRAAHPLPHARAWKARRMEFGGSSDRFLLYPCVQSVRSRWCKRATRRI